MIDLYSFRILSFPWLSLLFCFREDQSKKKTQGQKCFNNCVHPDLPKLQSTTLNCHFSGCVMKGWAHEACLSDNEDDDGMYFCSHNCRKIGALQAQGGGGSTSKRRLRNKKTWKKSTVEMHLQNECNSSMWFPNKIFYVFIICCMFHTTNIFVLWTYVWWPNSNSCYDDAK